MPRCRPTPQPRHLVLVGVTASGKSNLALELARRGSRDGPGTIEVLSVDSMQVYRGMDIGTAKPSRAERDEIRHHLIDIADPTERYTAARCQLDATDALAGIEARGHTAVVVGGTGLYLHAVLGDLIPPGEWPEVRRRLEEEPDTAMLHRRLAEADPVAARRMEPSNRRRVIRALEVTEGSGRPFSSFGPGVASFPDQPRFHLVGVWLPRHVVAARIDSRVRTMMQSGLLDEVKKLIRQPGGMGATARQALGYKELLAHVELGVPLSTMIDLIVTRTRAFSVRQRRWFRRDPRIRWHASADNPLALLPGLLRDLGQCRP